VEASATGATSLVISLANVMRATMEVAEEVAAAEVVVAMVEGPVTSAAVVEVRLKSATNATALGISHGSAVKLIAVTSAMALAILQEIVLEHRMNPCATTAASPDILHGSAPRAAVRARPAIIVANRATFLVIAPTRRPTARTMGVAPTKDSFL